MDARQLGTAVARVLKPETMKLVNRDLDTASLAMDPDDEDWDEISSFHSGIIIAIGHGVPIDP